MKPQTSNFQIIVLVIFGFFVLVGLVLFATNSVSNNSTSLAPVVMWGTFPSSNVSGLINALQEKDKGSLNISYVQKDSSTFETDLTEALADGNGPDIVILSQDMVIRLKSKLLTIPYTSISQRTFKDDYIDGASVFLDTDGAVTVPFIADPLVMYWNKSHFTNASIVTPPQYWDDFSADVLKLTKKDSNFNITQSGTAFGQYLNISHAKDILSNLFVQAGTSLIGQNSQGEYVSALSGGLKGDSNSSLSALTFYTGFADPTNPSYSWNGSFPKDIENFTGGELSMYFGLASELSGISLKNPNLNFDVSLVPQVRNTSQQSVFGKIYGLAILKNTKNINSAYPQVLKLTGTEAVGIFSKSTGLPPARKDLLSVKSADLYMQVFYDSALRMKVFLDPNPALTGNIFKNMIESVVVGKLKASEAINVADDEVEALIKK